MPATQVKISASPGSTAEGPARRDKRNHILDAAIVVFARLGYHGARISDIAREAGIAYGLVYHYFKNKEEVLSTIFEERWSGFLDAVEGDRQTSPKRPTEEKLDLHRRADPERPTGCGRSGSRCWCWRSSARRASPSRARSVPWAGSSSWSTRLAAGRPASRGELRSETLDPEVASYVFVGRTGADDHGPRPGRAARRCRGAGAGVLREGGAHRRRDLPPRARAPGG